MTDTVHTKPKVMCEQATRRGHCCDRAKWLSPAGLKVCGTHRNSIDLYYQRLNRVERCAPLSDEKDVAP